MFQCKMISSLTKVFLDQEPVEEKLDVSILRGETASFQVAVLAYGDVWVTAAAPGLKVTVREVEPVPVRYPCLPGLEDDNYLRKTPGLYPDLLTPMDEAGLSRGGGYWKAFWIDAEPEENTPAGDYEVKVSVKSWDDGKDVFFEGTANVHFVDCQLPKQKLLLTNWFHPDCLADYYQVEVWSEEHWAIVEKFVRSAVKLGINMLLTPLFTLALDTQVGLERTTVQLVDVNVDGGVYSFGFNKLERWVKMCQKCGITHFEMSHLYTQWSSNRTPKVMATVDGEYKRIFGWDVEGTSQEYRDFLAAFLPRLVEKLKELGITDCCRFHITDEPGEEFIPTYLKEKAQAEPYLEGMKMMDALSHFEFYKQGAVDYPVPATNAGDLPLFLESDVPEKWVYYCCGQDKNLSNRFIAMPSSLTRILGVQLYRYKIAGFLQWGFNFYNSVLSRKKIDPFAVTDGGDTFPAGDPFIVYPGEKGQPLESIRYMVFRQGIQDMRALELLEELAGRDTVEAIIAEGLEEELTLTRYPRDNAYLHTLRQRVNEEIEKRM